MCLTTISTNWESTSLLEAIVAGAAGVGVVAVCETGSDTGTGTGVDGDTGAGAPPPCMRWMYPIMWFSVG